MRNEVRVSGSLVWSDLFQAQSAYIKSDNALSWKRSSHAETKSQVGVI